MRARARLLITHEDLDGVASAILNEYFKLGYYPWFTNYNKTLPYFRKFGDIIITDFSIPKSLFDNLLREGRNVRIYDHHQLSEWITKYPQNCYRTDMCGSMIFFTEYIIPRRRRYITPAVEKFMKLVDILDRYQKQDPLFNMAQQLNRLFGEMCLFYGCHSPADRFKRFINAMVNKLHSGVFDFTEEERVMIQSNTDRENSLYETIKPTINRRIDERGYSFLVYSQPQYTPVQGVAIRLLEENDDIEYTICVRDGKLILRSKTVDVTEFKDIVGHKHAACSLTDDLGQLLIDGEMNELQLRDECSKTAQADDMK